MKNGTLIALPLSCLLGLGAPCESQAPLPQHPVTSSEASILLNQALSALGGQPVWSMMMDATANGNCTIDPTQAGTPQSPVRFKWTTAGDEFRYETDSEHDGPIMLSGHGKPSMTFSGVSQSSTYETARLLKPFHLPGLVLSSVLNNPQYYATVVGPESINGEPAIHLHVVRYLLRAVETGSDQDWWFDASTSLPIKVTYRAPGQQISAYLPISDYFSGWITTPTGLLFPQKFRQTLSDVIPFQQCSIDAVQFNRQPASAVFDAR